MAKSQKPKRQDVPKLPAQTEIAAVPSSHAVRETVESIVIAFVLAFLFRTFEAEAFVIPTGSMAPTLMGRHKDVDCPKCGYRYTVSASEENADEGRGAPSDCIAGMCPICRYVMPMREGEDLPESVPEAQLPDIPRQKSYNGDRILVNKYIYTFTDPERWDVVVFKFPGNAQMNYIKRLVGLPGETLQIFQGDLFVGKQKAQREEDFEIARKPGNKVLAMRQMVHDTEHDPAELDAAGWPLRWHSPSGDDGAGWKLEKTIDGQTVRQRYSVETAADEPAWLRYEHLVPRYDVWQELIQPQGQPATEQGKFFAGVDRRELRQLIMDANPYNGRVDRFNMPSRDSLQISPEKLGLHWVGDLMVEADVEVMEAKGELLLDLVEAGRHFTCAINMTNGEATLSAEGAAGFKPKAKTPIDGPGEHRVAFANFDDQLLVWVDGDPISFEGGTAYNVEQVFGSRRDILPQTSEHDLGDLAPAGIGARNAKLAVTRLQMWRDIYYIASEASRMQPGQPVSDFDFVDDSIFELRNDPKLWNRFAERRRVQFPLGNDQFFVMGDNSAESSDARLWLRGDHGQPGGAYLERRLLIGKALCVYWPHSWHRIPGTPIPFPLFPNVADMRLVR